MCPIPTLASIQEREKKNPFIKKLHTTKPKIPQWKSFLPVPFLLLFFPVQLLNWKWKLKKKNIKTSMQEKQGIVHTLFTSVNI